jgi:hypothetical protein
MIKKMDRCRKPRTVNEAAELLISDLLIQHLRSLSRLSEKEFNLLCDQVTPYMNEEFQIWQGNDDLLESCYRQECDNFDNPARIILSRVKEMLSNFNGFLVIT